MGYVDKEIARQQKIIGDAVAGKGLQKAIKALQDRSKIGDSLKALPARGAISAKRKVAKRTGSGADSSTVRTERQRTYYGAVQEMRSSDGLFTLYFRNVETIVFDLGTDRYLDIDPSSIT